MQRNDFIFKLLNIESRIKAAKSSASQNEELKQCMLELDAISSPDEVIMYKQKKLMYEVLPINQLKSEDMDVSKTKARLKEYAETINELTTELNSICTIGEKDFVRIERELTDVMLGLDGMQSRKMSDVKKQKSELTKKLNANFDKLEGMDASEETSYKEQQIEEFRVAIKKLEELEQEATNMAIMVLAIEDINELHADITNRVDAIEAHKDPQIKSRKRAINKTLDYFANFIDGNISLEDIRRDYGDGSIKNAVDGREAQTITLYEMEMATLFTEMNVENVQNYMAMVDDLSKTITGMKSEVDYLESKLDGAAQETLIARLSNAKWNSNDDLKELILNTNNVELIDSTTTIICKLAELKRESKEENLLEFVDVMESILLKKIEYGSIHLRSEISLKELQRFVDELVVYKCCVFEQLNILLEELE